MSHHHRQPSITGMPTRTLHARTLHVPAHAARLTVSEACRITAAAANVHPCPADKIRELMQTYTPEQKTDLIRKWSDTLALVFSKEMTEMTARVLGKDHTFAAFCAAPMYDTRTRTERTFELMLDVAPPILLHYTGALMRHGHMDWG